MHPFTLARRILLGSVTLLCCLAWPGGTARAENRGEKEPDAATVGKALKQGKFAVGLRYRFETVSDDDPAFAGREAHASTLRTTLGYRSARYRGFGVFVEFEDVRDIGFADQHNNLGAGSRANNVTGRPAIADPEGTELQQALLQIERLPGTRIDAGRMVLALADQRFVGPVGWRQNQQAFDALRVRQTSLPRTSLDYVFAYNVNRISGENKMMHSHFLLAEIEVGERGRVTPYVYLLDYDAAADAGLSTVTYGASWHNRIAAGGGWSIPYLVQYAHQRDAGDNPGRVDAGYRRVEIGGARKKFHVKAGWEVLEGNPADGRFTTPLATAHAYNGWADKFVVTPPNGLEDLYVEAGVKHGAVAATLVLHDFDSESLGLDYGTEVDARVVYTAPWKQTFAVKLALYDADAFAADTEKLMAWTTYAF